MQRIYIERTAEGEYLFCKYFWWKPNRFSTKSVVFCDCTIPTFVSSVGRTWTVRVDTDLVCPQRAFRAKVVTLHVGPAEHRINFPDGNGMPWVGRRRKIIFILTLRQGLFVFFTLFFVRVFRTLLPLQLCRTVYLLGQFLIGESSFYGNWSLASSPLLMCRKVWDIFPALCVYPAFRPNNHVLGLSVVFFPICDTRVAYVYTY